MAYFLANDSLSAFFFFYFSLFWGERVHRLFTEASCWMADKDLTLTLIVHLAYFCQS